jgi:hypothetical protein
MIHYYPFLLSNLDDEPDFDKNKINIFQRICSTVRKYLQKTGRDSQMKFYKFVARPELLCGSETWVTAKRAMTGLEAAEMCFLRSVKGYASSSSRVRTDPGPCSPDAPRPYERAICAPLLVSPVISRGALRPAT